MIVNKLIIGLGNPGKNYEYTRHNLGFLVLDQLAKQSKLKFKNCSFTKAVAAEDKINNIVYLKPMTYVNLSGAAVQSALRHYQLTKADILVVCDDLSLEFGEIRIRPSGSPGGHNGLKSIVSEIESQEFARLRMGIEHPGDKSAVVDYVLQKFDAREMKQLNKFIEEAAECCLVWSNEGINQAMNCYNKKKEK